jgi:hypothetical protein
MKGGFQELSNWGIYFYFSFPQFFNEKIPFQYILENVACLL